MADRRDRDEPTAFSWLYDADGAGTGEPESQVTWLQALRVPLLALALGVFLAYVGPVPVLGALIIIAATLAATMAMIMHLVGR